MTRPKPARRGWRSNTITAMAAVGLTIVLIVMVLMMRTVETTQTRAAIDQDVERATTVAQYVAAADRYARIGEADRARQTLDRAQRIATTSVEQHQIARAYSRLRRPAEGGPPPR
jgi:TRAP-type C4-dicarboxylate transport system permease large subunit